MTNITRSMVMNDMEIAVREYGDYAQQIICIVHFLIFLRDDLEIIDDTLVQEMFEPIREKYKIRHRNEARAQRGYTI